MALIQCNNLMLGYEDAIVLNNLNFQVQQGDYLCIIGENGSGKSTLIKALLGLRKPLSGSIVLGDGLKQNQIGYLPQQTPVQRDFPASIYEVVLSGRLNRLGFRPFYSKEDRKAACEQMERMGILDMKDRSYQELSGGQQQRVLLARALCATGKLLLLDEPVAGLDPVVTRELYAQIKKINKEQGITIIMVSHDIHEVIREATHILHLNHADTTPAFYGPAEAYKESEYGQIFTAQDSDTISNEDSSEGSEIDG